MDTSGNGDDDKNKSFAEVDLHDLTKQERQQLINNLQTQMQAAAKKLDFEQAATLRDTILELEAEK